MHKQRVPPPPSQKVRAAVFLLITFVTSLAISEQASPLSLVQLRLEVLCWGSVCRRSRRKSVPRRWLKKGRQARTVEPRRLLRSCLSTTTTRVTWSVLLRGDPGRATVRERQPVSEGRAVPPGDLLVSATRPASFAHHTCGLPPARVCGHCGARRGQRQSHDTVRDVDFRRLHGRQAVSWRK